MKSKINEELNKKENYSDSKCHKCGRKYPETLLNIEGFIHHNCKIKCLDRKKCEKISKKTVVKLTKK